jgi:hypothetical protein
MPNDRSEARLDVGDVLRGYGRRLAEEFREGTKNERSSAESSVRGFLSKRLPRRYGVAEGVVVDTHGSQSQRFDAVIFDRDRMPVLGGENDVTIWPFESVYAATEVRATLTLEGLRTAVENIAAFKALRRERETSAGTAGVTVSGEFLNPPVGLLVAHDHAEDLVPSEPAFNDVVRSVPLELQIDAYCIVSGAVGCRGQEAPRLGLLLGFNQGPTKLFHFTFGEGALSAFLLMITALLNKIRLGEPSLLRYLRAVAP